LSEPAVPDRIRIEQMRLLLGNLKAIVPQTALLVALLLWTLLHAGNWVALNAWAVAILGFELFCAWDARRCLATIESRPLRPLVRRQMALNAADGLLWAALPWIALDGAGVAASVLVIGVMCGIAAGALSSLAVVRPVFLAFLFTVVAATAAKLATLRDPAYAGLALAGILYCMTLVSHARNLSQSARAAIDLRFENMGLIERLRIESENARAAQRAADDSNLAKSRFLAAASHDLRQPIHAQGLFLSVLERSELSADQRAMVRSATAATAATAEMLNTLLDFSRIEAGVVQPAVRSFPLQVLLNTIESELAPQADAKGIVYRSRETRAVVRSDPAIVALILRNLVSNALRYTDRGGLLIGCRRRGAGVVLEVWDTGIGIRAADQEAIFREFHQLGNPERDRRKGLGLGLAIARGLARTLGHALTLESTPGRGTVFRLALPLPGADDPPVVEERGTPPASIAHARVLVIDDDEAVREGMGHVLRDWGCHCDLAGTIEEALVLADRHPPDAVVSDYRLRNQYTGADAIAALRLAHGAQLPALLVTGDTAPERLREAAAFGVPLLHKPVRPNELRMVLAAALRGDGAPGTQAQPVAA
jgi:signal transduction histidine kinase/CheY-like chemotaxis protein